MEEERQLDNGGIIMDSIKYVGTSVFSFIFEQYLTLVNTFLSSIQKQLAELVPEGSPVMNKYKQAQLMRQAINEVFADPVFKAQIETFGANIKATIAPFLREMNELLEREGDNLAGSAFKITNRVARNAMAGVLEGVEGALTLFPGVGTVIDLLNVLQGVLDSVSVVSVEFFKNMSKFMEAFLKIFGETSGPIVDTIKSVDELFNKIKSIQSQVNSKIADVSKIVEQIPRGGKRTFKKRKAKSIL
uniref:Uncharacterized protein n=1 Tax=viral metagenome TaxID=1070528 RepID=A0A6C0BVH8_9ZZZZ